MTDNNEQLFLIYKLRFENGDSLQYRFDQSDDTISLNHGEDLPHAEWMQLSHNQCDNCPLSAESHPDCPVAINLAVLLKDWHSSISFNKVQVEVISPQRTVSADTTAQKVLSSLLGLIIATSDCPHTHFFRAMAQFHLPLASSDETSFRAISNYLFTLYLRHQNGEQVDFDLSGLMQIYENMHTVNIGLKKRLESAVENDAALNAVVILDLLAITLPCYFDDEIEKFRQLFSKFLDKDLPK